MKHILRISVLLFTLNIGAAYAYDPDCGNECDDPPDCPPVGTNPINAGPANLYRRVTDLETFGTAPIQFTRIYNSRTTYFNDPYWDFGTRQTWQHNWNFEMRQLSTKSFNQFDIKVRYPDGREYNFAAPDSTSNQRIPPAKSGDRLYKWSGSTVGYTMISPDGSEYDFLRYSSPKFHLTEARNGQGLKWTFTYDTDGKLKRISNQFGRWLEIERSVSNGVSCISRVFSNDGRQIFYNYSAWTPTNSNLLTGVTYPGTETAAYTWVTSDPSVPSARPLLETASDPAYQGAGARTKYVYNYDAKFDYGSGPYLVTGTVKEERNLTTDALIVSLPLGGGTYPQILEGNGTEITRKFDKGQLKEIGDGEGRYTVYTRSDGGYGFIQSVMSSDGGTTSFTRDFAGRILTRIDETHQQRSYTYDSAGFELTRTDERSFTTATARDASHRPVRVNFPDGTYETWTYNIYGEVLTHRARNGGVETSSYYDGVAAGGKLGDLRTRADALNNVSAYTYNAAGNLATIKDARNNITSYTYNWRGLPLGATYADNTVVMYEYDAFGNRTRQINELGKVWETTYNEYQRVATKKDPLNRVTTYGYGREAGCLSCRFADTVSSITLPSGNKTEFTYDRSWKLKSRTVGAGTVDSATTTYAYNAAGDRVEMTDPRGKTWSYTYDAVHRKLSESDPLNHTTRTTYDASGNVLTETRADGAVNTYEYDAMNRRTKLVDPLLKVTQLSYDAAGNVATFSDAKNNVCAFGYDLLNRRISMTYAGGSHESWTYDATGNIASYTTRSGQTKSCTFDARNRETLAEWSDSTAGAICVYDAAGRVINLDNANSHLEYTYNDANEMVRERQGIVGAAIEGMTVSYAYDANGNRAKLTYPDGHNVAYAYTGRDQINTITADGPPPIATYTYDLNGNRLGKHLENGTSATYSYDNANRLLSLAHQNSSTTFTSFDYKYNTVNSRVSATRETGLGDTYTYDTTDQLSGAQYDAENPTTSPTNPVRTQNFAYDSVGNRTSTSEDGGSISYTVNSLNQYTALGTNVPTYDINGNFTSGAFDGCTFVYDSQNRLVHGEGPRAGSSSGAKYDFAYDARNRCVRQVFVPASTGMSPKSQLTALFYDGWNLLGEYVKNDSDDQYLEKGRYVRGMAVDEIIAKVDAADTVYFHEDSLGSTAALTNSAGLVIETYKYLAFGTPIISNSSGANVTRSSVENRFLFNGREWFAELATYDFRNRVYSTSLGRFLQNDPRDLGGHDLNLSRYCFNDPVNWQDPFGLDAKQAKCSITIHVGHNGCVPQGTINNPSCSRSSVITCGSQPDKGRNPAVPTRPITNCEKPLAPGETRTENDADTAANKDFEKAKGDAKDICNGNDGSDCDCKAVTITIECEFGMDLLGRLAMPGGTCGKSFTQQCSGK